jgi:asparagine synthase (glutamine-hydrolysing)
MCGIVGLYLFDRSARVERTVLEQMTSAISHRGPNGQGTFIDGNVGLGHRRLSVIDLDGGVQPMHDRASGRVIVYNGEIFNYRELREELRSGGVVLTTKSDTEVLLHVVTPAVDNWVHRLNGMFAFALWDGRSRSLLLMRDRFGVKPLYFINSPRLFAFASEIKALLRIPGVEAELDPDTVSEYLAFRHVLEPATMIRGVRQLPGGHFIHITAQTTEVTARRYWREADALDQLRISVGKRPDFREMLSSAVENRLVSDVPLGTFNSGGVDSSLVTREVRNHKTGELHTFSVGFSEQSHDESAYALEVARELGTTHHAEQLSADDYVALLPRAIWHHDEPLCHPHSVHLMHLCGVASRYVTVVLTGEGADEVFAGYPRLRIPLYSAALGSLAPWIGRFATGGARLLGLRRALKLFDAMSGSVNVAIDAHRFIDRDDLSQLSANSSYSGPRDEVLKDVSRQQTYLEQLLEYERRSYMQSLLLRLDKMSMAHGLEARTPFLDYRLVLWSKTFPQFTKVGFGWANKPLLKKEAARYFSHELVYRAKVGFGVPLTRWFREQQSFKDLLSDMCRPESLVSNFFPQGVVRGLIHEHSRGAADHTEALWVLLNIHLWKDAMVGTPDARLTASPQVCESAA